MQCITRMEFTTIWQNTLKASLAQQFKNINSFEIRSTIKKRELKSQSDSATASITGKNLQNRKSVTYCNAARRGPSHSHVEHAQKIWWIKICMRGSWNMLADRQTDMVIASGRSRLTSWPVHQSANSITTYVVLKRRTCEVEMSVINYINPEHSVV